MSWPCLFKIVTGLPCPGCGLTRAFSAVMHGDMKSAFFFHPLFWLVPVAALLFVISRSSPAFREKFPGIWRLGILALASFLGLWVVRLTVGIPGVASHRW